MSENTFDAKNGFFICGKFTIKFKISRG